MTTEEEDLRYEFGKNWAEFVDRRLNDKVIEDSRQHIADMLRTDSLAGKIFLDIGCGSGIHSLAALRFGADRVISFDYDRDSVVTTERVRAFAGSPSNWQVMQGSVLDADFMAQLPQADIVYSWGVLHHTGDMWAAVRNAAIPLKPDGEFYIALYSSDNYVDPPPQYWLDIKRKYNRASDFGKRVLEWRHMLRFNFWPELRSRRNPFALFHSYGVRGMTYWTDVRDWLGGWPMDFASLAETQTFCTNELSLTLVNVLTGEGCTEYVFARPYLNAHWAKIVAERMLTPLRRPFQLYNGFCYSAALPALEKSADSNDAKRRSRLMLYEDGVMLGLAHTALYHIARYGRGRHRHWGSHLYFSSSDNSNPNENGRNYAYCERF